jgi:hypothetical protein
MKPHAHTRNRYDSDDGELMSHRDVTVRNESDESEDMNLLRPRRSSIPVMAVREALVDRMYVHPFRACLFVCSYFWYDEIL